MTISNDEREIRALIEGINKAHLAKDAGAIVAHYQQDARIFDLAPPLAGRMIAAEVAAWLATWDGPVERISEAFEVTVGGEIAFASGYFRTSATTRVGAERAVFWSRATLCLVKNDSKWTIVHEHTSVPFYMDGSYRAATDLEP